MKKLLVLFCAGACACFVPARGADLKESKFTQVVNDVQIITPDTNNKRAAEVDGLFKMPEVLRTGAASRAELVAEDRTITRVGANTIFSFDRASRSIRLEKGSLLFNSPKGKGGGSIHTAAATAAVIGTTIIVTTTPDGGFKILTLEGKAEVKFVNGLKQKLDAGQMTFVLPGGLPGPVIMFRLDAQIFGSQLVKGFAKPLESQPKIESAVAQQVREIKTGRTEDTGLLVGDQATPTGVQVIKLFDQVSASSSDGVIPGLNGEEDDGRPRLPPGFPIPEGLVFDDTAGGFTPASGEGLLFISSGASGTNPPVAIEASARPAEAALIDQTIASDLSTEDRRVFRERVDVFDPHSEFDARLFSDLTGFIGQTIDINTGTISLNQFAPLERFTFLSLEDMNINQDLQINASQIPLVTLQAASGHSVNIGSSTTLIANTPSFVINSPGGLTLDSVTIQKAGEPGNTGTLDLFSLGDISLSDSTISADSVRMIAGGALSLTEDDDSAISGTSSVNLTSNAGMTIEGDVTGGSVTLINNADVLAVRNGSTIKGSSITLTSPEGVELTDSRFEGNNFGIGGLGSVNAPVTIVNTIFDLNGSFSVQGDGTGVTISEQSSVNAANINLSSFGPVTSTDNTFNSDGGFNIFSGDDVTLTDSAIEGSTVQINALDALVATRTGATLGDIRGDFSVDLEAENGLALGVNVTAGTAPNEGSISLFTDSGALTVAPGVTLTGGSIDVNSGNTVAINGATLAGGFFDVNAGNAVTISGATISGNRLDASAGDDESGSVSIRNSTVTLTGALDVNAGDGVTLENNGTINAAQVNLTSRNEGGGGGSVSVEDTVNTTIRTTGGIFVDADAVSLNNTTLHADTDVQIDGGTVALNNATLNAPRVTVTSDTFLSIPNVVPNTGAIIGVQSVNLTAQSGGMTIGVNVSADATSGSININNNSGVLNVNGGKTFQAAMVNVSSPGGLLFDNTTINAGTRVSLTAGSQQGTLAVVQGTSFLGASDVSIAGHTVVLSDVNFAAGSTVDLRSSLGQLAPNPNTSRPVQGGFVNYIRNVFYDGVQAQDRTGVGQPITIRPLQ